MTGWGKLTGVYFHDLEVSAPAASVWQDGALPSGTRGLAGTSAHGAACFPLHSCPVCLRRPSQMSDGAVKLHTTTALATIFARRLTDEQWKGESDGLLVK